MSISIQRIFQEGLGSDAIRFKEPDWSESETPRLEGHKNPMIDPAIRLQIADGSISFRDRVIENLRLKLTEAEKEIALLKDRLYYLEPK